MSICFMRTVWGWLPRKPGPAGPAPETMPPEPGGTEDCMGPVLRGKPHWVLLLGGQGEKGREERKEVNVVTSHLNESTGGWGMGYSLPMGSLVAHIIFP